MKKINHFRRFSLPISLLTALILLLCAPITARATDLTISPSSGVFAPGSPFSVDVMVSNNAQAINAVSGVLSFPTDMLSISSISKEGSIIKLWAEEPLFSNTAGSVNFEGVILNPGFSAVRGRVIRIIFVPKKAGKASLSFGNASILANDGKASSVLGQLGTADFSVSTAVQIPSVNADVVNGVTGPSSESLIRSSTHPNPNRWYNNNAPVFSWDVPSTVTAVRIQYDRDPSSTPTKTYDPAISQKALEDVPDGTYYFHLQSKDAEGWGEVFHFRFQIDTVPPNRFSITFPHGEESKDPQPIIHFNTTDALAGVDRYEIKIGEGNLLAYAPEAISNPYAMPPQTAGKHTVLVRAIDRAGNSTSESADFTIISILAPVIALYPKELEESDLLKVRGTTYPDASVDLLLKNSEGETFSEFAKSNSLGDFATVWSKKLPHDVYELTAVVTDGQGAKSAPSEAVTIIIRQKPLIQFGIVVINYLTLFILIIISLGALAAVVWYIFSRFTILKRRIRRDMTAIEDIVLGDLQELKDDLHVQFHALERAKSKRALTAEEMSISDNLKKHITRIEKDIISKVEIAKKNAR